jgi:hypothetical protein
MGAPTSAILAETFIQHLEHALIWKILQHRILDYYRYVDDILIVYNTQLTNTDDNINEINKVHSKIKFTIEKEVNNQINYLDLIITKEKDKFTYALYRKPTTTHAILHNQSCHPGEHKKAATRFLFNHLNTYPLTQKNKECEYTIIKEIMENNGYQQIHEPHKHTHENTNNSYHTLTPNGKKWVTFTYSGPEVRMVTKLF